MEAKHTLDRLKAAHQSWLQEQKAETSKIFVALKETNLIESFLVEQPSLTSHSWKRLKRNDLKISCRVKTFSLAAGEGFLSDNTH